MNPQLHAKPHRTPNIPAGRAMLARLCALTFTLCLTTAAAAQTFGPLRGQAFGDGDSALIVIAHGDVSGGGPATYHFDLARQIAPSLDAVTVALLRPGYSNGWVTSPGNNHERWDQYTTENNDLLAQTLQSLRTAYPDRPLIAVGHSGGAAQLGAIIGRYPGLVDTAILVACPCNFVDWRSRYNRQMIRGADQSPEMHIATIADTTRIITLTGSLDDNTYPGLSLDYVANAQARGLDAQAIVIDGSDHWDAGLIAALTQTLSTEVAR